MITRTHLSYSNHKLTTEPKTETMTEMNQAPIFEEMDMQAQIFRLIDEDLSNLEIAEYFESDPSETVVDLVSMVRKMGMTHVHEEDTDELVGALEKIPAGELPGRRVEDLYTSILDSAQDRASTGDYVVYQREMHEQPTLIPNVSSPKEAVRLARDSGGVLCGRTEYNRTLGDVSWHVEVLTEDGWEHVDEINPSHL